MPGRRLPRTFWTARAVRPAEAVHRSVWHMHLCLVWRGGDMPKHFCDLPRRPNELALQLCRPRLCRRVWH